MAATKCTTALRRQWLPSSGNRRDSSTMGGSSAAKTYQDGMVEANARPHSAGRPETEKPTCTCVPSTRPIAVQPASTLSHNFQLRRSSQPRSLRSAIGSSFPLMGLR